MSVLAMRNAIDSGKIVRYQTLNGCEVWGEWTCCKEDDTTLTEYCTLVRNSINHNTASEQSIHLSNSVVDGMTHVTVAPTNEIGTMQCIDVFLRDMRRAVMEYFHPDLKRHDEIQCQLPSVWMIFKPESNSHVIVSEEEWLSFNKTCIPSPALI